MPDPFDARAYDPYSTELLPDRDLPTFDRQTVYEARGDVIPVSSDWPRVLAVLLFLEALVGVMAWVTWPVWQQVINWMGW